MSLTAPMIILGDSGIGKTCLLDKLCEIGCNKEYRYLGGEETTVVSTVESTPVGKGNLQLWDTPGNWEKHNRNGSIVAKLEEVDEFCVVIFAFSCTDKASADNVVSKWLPRVQSLQSMKNSTFVLVMTKCDSEEKFAGWKEKKKSVAASVGDRISVYEVSGVDADLTETVLSNLNNLWNLLITAARGFYRLPPPQQQVDATPGVQERGNSSKGTCFASSSLLAVAMRDQPAAPLRVLSVSMSELSEMIHREPGALCYPLCVDQGTRKVFVDSRPLFFGHRDPTAPATFVRISVDGQHAPLLMSASHLLPIPKGHLVRADSLREGDVVLASSDLQKVDTSNSLSDADFNRRCACVKLQPRKVRAVSLHFDEGYYAPLGYSSDLLIVDGMVVHGYTTCSLASAPLVRALRSVLPTRVAQQVADSTPMKVRWLWNVMIKRAQRRGDSAAPKATDDDGIDDEECG